MWFILEFLGYLLYILGLCADTVCKPKTSFFFSVFCTSARLIAGYLWFIVQLQQQLQEQQNEISRETRLKEKLDKEVKKLHVDMEAKAGDIRALTVQLQRATEEQQRLEQQLKELKVNTDKRRTQLKGNYLQTRQIMDKWSFSSFISSQFLKVQITLINIAFCRFFEILTLWFTFLFNPKP